MSAGQATHIAFTTQPGNAIGGSTFVSQPVVTIRDAGDNTVTSDTHGIVLTIHSGPGILSGCFATTTAGVATFSGCAINTAGTYTLTATDASDALSANSAAFDVGAGVPTQLAFSTEPAGATGGTAFTTQPVVAIEDAGGNTVTSASSTVTLAIGSGAGTLSGCSATTTSGVASFSACSIDTTGAYTLTATDAPLTPATSSSFNVTVGAANHLVFATSPSGATGGTAFTTQPVVRVEDAGGNTATSDASIVTLSITAMTPTVGGPGTLICAPTAASGGVVTFTGCSIDTAGTGYQLHAVDGGLTTADSTPFDVTVGPANHAAFTTSPAGATGGTAFATQPVVTIEDAGGNTVTSASSTVTLSITVATPVSGGPGTLTCAPTAASSGVASFTGCSIDTAGSDYQLHAVDGSLADSDSSAFGVTVGPATHIVFTTQPGNATAGTAFGRQPVVTFEDAGGNTVTGDADSITMTLGSGAGTLSGCAQTNSGGVVTFTGCSIDTAGPFSLSAGDGLFNALSDIFTVT